MELDSRPPPTERNSRNMNTLMNTLARCRLVLACCVGLSLSSIAALDRLLLRLRPRQTERLLNQPQEIRAIAATTRTGAGLVCWGCSASLV